MALEAFETGQSAADILTAHAIAELQRNDMQDNVTSASLIASMAARSTMSSICQQLPDGVLLQYPYLPVDPKVPASPELFLNMFLFLFLTQPFAEVFEMFLVILVRCRKATLMPTSTRCRTWPCGSAISFPRRATSRTRASCRYGTWCRHPHSIVGLSRCLL